MSDKAAFGLLVILGIIAIILAHMSDIISTTPRWVCP